jgi:hypothetical protein
VLPEQTHTLPSLQVGEALPRCCSAQLIYGGASNVAFIRRTRVRQTRRYWPVPLMVLPLLLVSRTSEESGIGSVSEAAAATEIEPLLAWRRRRRLLTATRLPSSHAILPQLE